MHRPHRWPSQRLRLTIGVGHQLVYGFTCKYGLAQFFQYFSGAAKRREHVDDPDLITRLPVRSGQMVWRFQIALGYAV